MVAVADGEAVAELELYVTSFTLRVTRLEVVVADEFLKFEDWEKTIPNYIKKDPLWESLYYHVALYLYNLVWDDCDILQKDSRARHNIAQLMHTSGSVSANMEEAFGRGVGTPDYVRILKISLGEIRDTGGWYYRSLNALPADLLEHRYKVVDQLRSLVVNRLNLHKGNLGRKTQLITS